MMTPSNDRAQQQPAAIHAHGTLPFVGRTPEIEKIVEFWRGTVEAQGLRTLLVVGEAGIGKSRLLEVAMAAIRERGGAVVHIKLYPESAASLPRLLAAALRSGSDLTLIGPDEHLGAIIGGLQRLARLRPTLLVLEDIHLLNETALGDTATILQALTDEALSVVCVARNVDFTPRGILERHLVDEIRIGGLSKADLHEMWKQLFGAPAHEEVTAALERTTRGNPLAVRSALAAAYAAGAIIHDEAGGTWKTCVAAERFEEILSSGVGELAEGMAAHLDADERAASEAIASLGEIFSREAAGAVLDNAEPMLERLASRGVIAVVSTSPAPVMGTHRNEYPASNFPLLAFTHSLLHTHFMHDAAVDTPRIAVALGLDLPLYSLLPFQLLGRLADRTPLESPHLANAVLRAVGIAYVLDESSNWQLALPVLQGAEALAGRAAPGTLPEGLAYRIRTKLLGCRLSLLRRHPYDDNYRELVDRFLACTADPRTEEEGVQRLLALTHRYRLHVRTDHAHHTATWGDVETLLELFPDLESSVAYVLFLREVAQFARRNENHELSTIVEQKLMGTLALPGTGEHVRRIAAETILPTFLVLFTTEEELAGRLRLFDELKAVPDARAATLMPKLHFLMMVGKLHEARSMALSGAQVARDHGLLRTQLHALLVALYADTVLGLDVGESRGRAAVLDADAPEDFAADLRANIGFMLAMAGLLRNERAWAVSMLETYSEAMPFLTLPMRICAALQCDGEPGPHVLEAPAQADADPALHTFATHVLQGDAGIVDTAREALSIPLLRNSDILVVHAVLDLIDYLERSGRHPNLSTLFHKEITDVAARSVEWCCERKQHHVARGIVIRHSRMIAGETRTRLEKLIDSAAQCQIDEQDAPPVRLKVAMLGMIAVETGDGKLQRLRGARLRTLLALMVADRMLEHPLEHREFCHIAAGNHDTAEHARKVVNISVHRLREIMGADAILTDTETPRLNSNRVSVDLLEVTAQLDEVDDALARGALMRATTLLLKAFEATQGEVPFPSLYDPFFAAARRDFEDRMRSTAADVVRALLYEGDVVHAELVLEQVQRMTYETGDGAEIAELSTALDARRPAPDAGT